MELQPTADEKEGGDIPRISSRFQVNKVDADDASGNNASANQVCQNSADEAEDAKAKQVKFCVADENLDDNSVHSNSNVNTRRGTFCKSFREVQTVERVPDINHYRNILSIEGAIASRPSLAELHEEHYGRENAGLENFKLLNPTVSNESKASTNLSSSAGLKLGWIQGVLMRCFLSILGTILFLRISWMAAYAGIGYGLLVIFIGAGVSVITSLSMCAICTNGDIKGGGAYFMISRSMGPEFGGSIGLIFAFANVVSASFCVVGFSETLRDVLMDADISLFDGGLNAIRFIGVLTAILIMGIVCVGISFESKAQVFMLFALAVSLVDFMVGTFLPVNDEKRSRGVTGYTWDTFSTNFFPDWRGETFFSVFSVYYPATTGIMAGANISGDLADPSTAIPLGTLLAILLTSLIYAGTLVITGSTALGKDRLFPGISWFSVGYGKNDEPRRAYLLGFFLMLGIVSIGDINTIAPIISNFFLACYALMNYAVFDASFAGSPGFRPSFKYYNQWLALFGALICIAIMFVISWWTSLLTFAFVGALYVYLHYRKPDVNWGSSGQAHSYKNALHAALKLSSTEEHVKNYRPQILVLTGNPMNRPSLVTLQMKRNTMDKLVKQLYYWFQTRQVKSFYTYVISDSLNVGLRMLLQCTGIGKLRPNVVLIGFKNDWLHASIEEIRDYFLTIHTVFDQHCGLAILRLKKGLDLSEQMAKCDDSENGTSSANPNALTVGLLSLNSHVESDECFALRQDSYMSSKDDSERTDRKGADDDPFHSGEVLDFLAENSGPAQVTLPHVLDNMIPSVFKTTRNRHMSVDQRALLDEINQFQTKVKRGIIDVYWLFDDGGLGLLVPHLLTQAGSFMHGAKLRVFTVASSRSQLEREQRSMAALLSRFRIDYSGVMVIPDLSRQPSEKLIKEFNEFIMPYMVDSDSVAEHDELTKGIFIRDSDFVAQKSKTYRQLRIKELLQEHSTNAHLVVLTLPVPRKGVLPACLYLAWLDFVSRDVRCPLLFLRGNQQAVLTFYS
ncbi:amino acid permease family protein [Trichinella spiralis]|uniref:Solute carrier family 12 member 3 n=1 Tax=Trichinella spiralis TaxID=6334 RepID=E5S1W5_TRISP|nr:amino acid permease family protein [Trichinella spiralis]KRY37597.1 Solute carrier family 12 member 3 [Trichinella spiralis]